VTSNVCGKKYPSVAQVEDAVEGEEPAVAGRQRPRFDGAAVEEGSVGVPEQRIAAPVARDVDERPVLVREADVGEPAGEVAVLDVRPPPTRQVDRNRVGRCEHHQRDYGR
jgi:hypothetical protein